MNIVRSSNKPKAERWARYKYNLTTPIGENGKRVTGCKEHIELSRRAAGEGMVLLENNGILPLAQGSRIALFGIGSIDYVKGGGGSGQVYCAYTRNIYEGFKEKQPRFSLYEPLSKYYYDYTLPLLSQYDAKDNNESLFDEIELPESLVKSAAENSDVAVITVHRFSGEGWDRRVKKGDFYLTDTEQKLIDDVTEAFEHSVIILDVGGMVDVSYIKENKKIDAALLAWQAGMEGGLAIADILCGDVNPSGKLVDTFAKTFADYPSADSFHESNDYVCYYEDIYVGYRYFETIPEAKDKVVYPFGYGLSYTDFEISEPKAEFTEDSVKITVSVKNIGKMAGKEVVQAYYSAPQGVLEKPKIELVAFEKTRLLQPNESQKIELTFKIADMASYDDLGKLKMSAYLLEGGEYHFFVGNSCRNLKEAKEKYTVSEPFVVTEQLSQLCAPNRISKRMLSDGSFEALPEFPIKSYPEIEYVNPAKAPEREKPAQFSEVAEGKITLEEFMAQMTDDELVAMVSGISNRGVANTCGMGGIDRLGIPAFMTVDGPAGVRILPQVEIATTAFPCATLLACSWNTDLMYEIGKAGALECKENGLAVWLTPALNIHRNPLCGRNFEYFSEDPLVAGKFAAAKVRGIQSQGVASSAKHFACNNKESNRLYSDSRLSERALREIYLKGFEICVKEADPWTIMTGYNIINGRRCCENYEQLELILRGEWDFKGMVTSDWGVPCNQPDCIRAGNDIRMPNGFPDQLNEALLRKKLKRSSLEICVKKILEMFLKLD